MDEPTRERLAKLLGMLGSSHDGEVLNAARAAEQLRRKANLTWDDILKPQLGWQPGGRPRYQEYHYDPQPDPPPHRFSWKDAAQLLASPITLSQWERDFLDSIVARQWDHLTPKQAAIIERLQRRRSASP
jgi:hypothetical protein